MLEAGYKANVIPQTASATRSTGDSCRAIEEEFFATSTSCSARTSRREFVHQDIAVETDSRGRW